MSAWLLPDHIADVLPPEARCIETLRRSLLDTARGYGYELVIPPLVEHLDSLLTGTGEALGLQTYKLVDQISGRTLGVRADATPQVARIDAHMLARRGIARLCYCGPVLHTRPERALAPREPLQLGAEIYGCAGREADLEIMLLALDCLRVAGVDDFSVDLADERIVRALLSEVTGGAEQQAAIHRALAAKDPIALTEAGSGLPPRLQQELEHLMGLYGNAEVLDEAERLLGQREPVRQALTDLRWLARHLAPARISFDLADARGWGYYTGPRFSVYADGVTDALLRGGRYDGVGAVFGHDQRQARPAVGFSLELKQLARVAQAGDPPTAIRAPWRDDAALLAQVQVLRNRGEIVAYALPGHERENGQLSCDRELVLVDGQWRVVAC